MSQRLARFVLAPAALVAAVACASGRPAAAPAAAAATPPAPVTERREEATATVWPTYAVFEFPLPNASVWRWRESRTAPGVREYAWLIAIPDSAGRAPEAGAQAPEATAARDTAAADSLTSDALAAPARFEFGFSLFQPAAVATEPAEGGFHALLTDGQSDLWERTSDGARRMPRLGVLAVPRYHPNGTPRSLEIQLRDPVLVTQLFAARPLEVIAIEQLPGEPLRARRILVRYAGKDGR
jgi:hypothetical protein